MLACPSAGCRKNPSASHASVISVFKVSVGDNVQEQAEAPLVTAGVMPKDFVDSWAVNVYHDGSEGIQSHYDDAGRFLRPITSLRLFSDCRLSFGTQLYG